ncbi:tripartite tricarboxylate transporter TctB family protein [Propylenella binzhouense]|uniref:Tripartite tricarboxylate transporter TctB family protein n=1 Tax=Propylenella binzhouense TaxID=2555902 RepID=A0A964WT54_9HYPH|nr:tripartite tricarboxylate transporter TctB family protein [Propylenella binzhouense]MYZ47659.1 tripartite tricarboxylate transporter TctB family protein [Propylenella binzhouense]
MKLRHPKDFAAGLLYVGVGGAFAVIASGYRMGTAARMGPGYFPFWLGVLLMLIGAAVIFGALRGKDAEADAKLSGWDLKSLAIVLAAVVLFGVLLQPMGLVAAVAVLVLVASVASHEFSWRAAALNAVVLVGLAVVIFVYGLGLQFHLWPALLAG